MNSTKNELAYIRSMLTFLETKDAVSIVGDAFDIFSFCELLGSIKDEVIEKTKNGKFVVIRPDSGDPLVVLPKMLKILEKHFGSKINEKGYKVLNNVRVIWGDGIDRLALSSILRVVVDVCHWSADNLTFGMGGALLGRPQRDDVGFAMKCSAVRVNGEWRDVFKDPITDSGKTSKKGRVTLFKGTDGKYYSGREDWMQDELVTYYDTGKLALDQTLEEIRQRSNQVA